MDFLEKFKAFLVSMSPQLFLPPSQPPTLPIVDLESHQQPIPPSPLPSTNTPETLQPHSPPPPPSSTFSIELLQPPFPTNQPESSQQQSQSLPPSPTTPSNLKQPVSTAALQHLQWKNSVLSFCFSYAIALSLQYAQTDHRQPNSSLGLLSFLILLTFNIFLLALFIRPNSTKTSEILEKVGFLVAAAAFCLAIAVPFQFELKCAVFSVFLLSLLLLMTFIYVNRKVA